MNDKTNKYAPPEHLLYAKVLAIGIKLGFIMLVISFILYMTGILPPLIPLDQLPKYWNLSAADFAKATHNPTGWAWVKDIGKGDILNLTGIVVLASLSAVSTLAIIPMFVRQREKALLVISVLLIAVLALSASNIIGGH